jgi:hypothetical protein
MIVSDGKHALEQLFILAGRLDKREIVVLSNDTNNANITREIYAELLEASLSLASVVAQLEKPA